MSETTTPITLDEAYERVVAADAAADALDDGRAQAATPDLDEAEPAEAPAVETDEDAEDAADDEQAEAEDIDLAEPFILTLDDGREIETNLSEVAEAAAAAVTLRAELEAAQRRHEHELADRTVRAQQAMGDFFNQGAALMLEGMPAEDYFLQLAATSGVAAAQHEREWWGVRAEKARAMIGEARRFFEGASRDDVALVTEQRQHMFSRLASDLARDEPAYRDVRVVQREAAAVEAYLQRQWGYTADETAAITDPRVYRIVRENLLLRQAYGSSRQATRQAQPAPTAARPAAAVKSSTVTAAKARFGKTRSLDDAYELSRLTSRKS